MRFFCSSLFLKLKNVSVIHFRVTLPLSKQNVTGYYVPRNDVVSKTVNQKIYSGVPNNAGGGGGCIIKCGSNVFIHIGSVGSNVFFEIQYITVSVSKMTYQEETS